MAFVKRIFLFLAVNLLVMVTISIVLNLLGVGPWLDAQGINYPSLMAFCLVWGFGGAFISLGLSRIMAKMMMGVKVIDPKQAAGEEAWLVETVHQLSRSAGLSRFPEVGVYESPELNAFATGPTRSRALVAVSTGLLRRMSRSEVEGVLGHEIAHVANGDMVTMTLVQGVVNAFVMFFARVIAFAGSQLVKEENRPMVRMVLTIVLDIALSILGSIVVAYYSRIREFRADKGGAVLAGREKMVGALRALQRQVLEPTQEKDALATLKISGRKSGMLALFSTHPDLEERIARLES